MKLYTYLILCLLVHTSVEVVPEYFNQITIQNLYMTYVKVFF